MKNKIIVLLVCMLVIGTTIPSLGALNLPTPLMMKEHLSSERSPTTPPHSPGTLITISVRARVLAIYDPYNFLEGKIKFGQKITGTYTYDADTPDYYPEYSDRGLYIMNDTSCGVEFNVGGLTFKTDQNNPLTNILILNDVKFEGKVNDVMEVHSTLDFPLSKELVSLFYFEFIDSTATALSSIALPTTAPVLRKWENKSLSIYGYDEYYNYFVIFANVTLVIKQYGADLQEGKSVVRQSLTTTPPIVPILVIRFWMKVVERCPNAFPTLRHFLGY
jgi:hypothetical protein